MSAVGGFGLLLTLVVEPAPECDSEAPKNDESGDWTDDEHPPGAVSLRFGREMAVEVLQVGMQLGWCSSEEGREVVVVLREMQHPEEAVLGVRHTGNLQS